MTRTPSLLLSALLAAVLGVLGLAVVTTAPAQAITPVTGRLVDAMSGKGAAGVRVRLLTTVRDGAGTVVDATTTDADGDFTLVGPPDFYYVQVLGGRYQGGWVDRDDPHYVVRKETRAGVFESPEAIGDIGISPAFITGRLVDAASGLPVAGVKVRGGTYRQAPSGTDVTDRRGRFTVSGLRCSTDCYLRFRGVRSGYESGQRGCDGQVVPIPEACATPLGRIGKVRIDNVGPGLDRRAGDPLTGRIVDVVTDAGVGGQTVRLRTVTADGPGAIVATDSTAANGAFSLDPGVTPDDEYYVQVLAGSHQGGYVGGSPRFVQPDPGNAATYGAGAALGQVLANPAFIRGRLVDADTRRPVRGVRVFAGTQGEPPVDSVLTDAKGRFLVHGITCEDECYLRFRGRPRGYENGFRGCGAGVVPTWGEACASPLGGIGKVGIEKL